jgi:hypothetical protein
MTNYTLALTFDTAQKLDNLQYSIYPSDDAESLDTKTSQGIFAGCYCVKQGDSLNIQINVTHEATQGKVDISIEKILLDMVCLPSCRDNPSNNGQNDGLSPYSAGQATHSVTDWNNLPATINQAVTVFNSNTILPIQSTGGEWRLKGYLSVVSTINNVPTQRVLSFDPEFIVGTGKKR